MSFYPNCSPQVEKATPSDTFRAALDYARRGWRVLPLHSIDARGVCTCGGPEINPKCSPGKHPRWARGILERGCLDATTDLRRIHAWWNRWPGANVGVATGELSGILALDVDRPPALKAHEAERGELPATRTHATGTGGMHYLFSYPATGERFGNSAGKLEPGLDIRAEGGYIVAPPSHTIGPYEVLNDLSLAETPEWLLEALRGHHNSASPRSYGITDRGSAENPDSPGPFDATGGEPIPEGSRNETLARIAGRLHNGSRDLDTLNADLMAINEARCTPPLPEAEVSKIAASIHRRDPCKRTGPIPTPEVLDALDEIEAHLWRREWPGMGGKSERDAYIALIKAARVHGQMIHAGVRVSIGVRSWALAAAVSKRAMLDYWKNGERKPGIISRLKRARLIRADNANRGGTEAGALVLLRPPRAEFHHSTTAPLLRTTENASGETLRAPRLRWSAPVVERIGAEVIRSVIRRLGKGCGAVIDVLERRGGKASVPEIAAALHIKRPRDARRRYITLLEETSVVECSEGGDTVALSEGWIDALNRAREIGGEIEAARRDMQRYALEQEAYRNRHRIRTTRAPTRREMDERRWSRIKPSGRISELERESEHFPDVFVDRGDPQVPLGERYTERKVWRMVRVCPEPHGKPSLPALSADGIYHHAPTCACWLCEGRNALECVSFAGVGGPP